MPRTLLRHRRRARLPGQARSLLPRPMFRLFSVAAPGLLLDGCAVRQWPILHADGPVARSQHELLLIASLIMLIVVAPVIVMAIGFAWRYRAGNSRACYRPEWARSRTIDAVVWAVPALMVMVLGSLVWHYTHQLDPYRPLATGAAPLEIQAVALDWKWLFIYPGQNIASVNELALPAGRPVRLKITSDTVMNSFFIPALAGQIYAMAGMQTQLNLMAERPARLAGRNMQFSGAGFPEQTFVVNALPPDAFAAWVDRARAVPRVLDTARYAALAKPGARQSVEYYSAVKPALFADIMQAYSGMQSAH